MKILEINNLNVYYLKKGKRNNIIDNFSLTIDDKEFVALIGKSGVGKTTIAKTIIGFHKLYEGEIIYNTKKEDIQYIFQDPYSSLNPYMNVSYITTEGMKFKNEQDKDEEIIKVMKLVNLDVNKRFCYPSEFSGGERQKISIARAIIRKPKLIIADEITSSLDYFSKIMIIDLLQSLQKNNNFSCLLISHDLEFINKLTDKIIILD